MLVKALFKVCFLFLKTMLKKVVDIIPILWYDKQVVSGDGNK